ncbi:MAG: aminopeptidase P family N-terminal domain-containing protein, partial [Bdellovibrionales bacterium]|nr:aminopeptidase P family N-terminal domain-containing protein [Oligoflexia bacterium]
MRLIHDFPKTTEIKPDLKQALNGLEKAFGNLDAIVLTSKDPNLSEYVPLENNPRYGASHFTGSVGDAIYFTDKFRKENPAQKPLVLFVDGRYHLQADQETNPELTEVVKLEVEPNIEGGVRERLGRSKGLQVGIDFERTSIASLARFEKLAQASGLKLVHVQGTQVLTALGLPGWTVDKPIFSLPETATGRSPLKTLTALALDMNAKTGHDESLHITCATDDAAFLLNARGYHLPHTGSFLAYTFFVGQELILFLGASSKNCEVNLEAAQCGDFKVTVIRDSIPELKAALAKHKVQSIFFNGATLNALLPTVAKELFPHAKVNDDYTWLMKNRTKKTTEEMATIRTAFIRSSRAI